jgi:hypothetical protein
MAELLKAMILVLASWVALFFVFSGVGLIPLRLFGLPGATHLAPRWMFLSFWLGWALTLAILQLWHLAFAVNWVALCLVWLLGMVGLFLYRRELWALLKTEWRERKRVWLAVGLAALWLANLALGGMTNYDDSLYRLQSMKWAESYPIVPGLGNVHGRLAHNSSYFLYAALLDVGEWAGRAYHLAAGLLSVVLLAHSIRSLAALFSARGKKRIYPLFNSLLLAPILIEVSGGNISSLSTAMPAFVLGVVLLGETLRVLLHAKELDGREETYTLVWFAALACAGLVVERSFTSLAVTAFLIVLAAWLVRRQGRTRRETLKALGWAAAAVGFIVVPWMARGVILSGYPFYPSVFGGFNVPWRVPRALVISEANWIRSWPRTPNVFWGEVLGDLGWLRSWADSLPRDLLRALEVTFFAGIFALFARKSDRRAEPRRLSPGLFLLPAVVSLIFWFNSAPNPRFAMGSFWALAAGSVALAASRLSRPHPDPLPVGEGEPHPGPLLRGEGGVGLFVVVLAFFVFLSPLRAPLIVAPGADAGFHALPNTPYQGRVTAGGFVVYLPQAGDRCGNAPLPCTPYYRTNLQSVLAGGTRYGFMLDDSVTYLDIHGTTATADPTLPSGLSLLYQTGWYSPEPGAGIRWMSTPSRLLFYTEQARIVRLTLTPVRMHVRGNFGDAGQMRVLLNGKATGTFQVRKDTVTEVVLHLGRDFNFVTLQFLGGNFVPKDSVPGLTDARTLAIAFYPIEIRAEP